MRADRRSVPIRCARSRTDHAPLYPVTAAPCFLLFVGYQSRGTPGHAIEQYGPWGGYVVLDGECFDTRPKVTSIGGYSAHADQNGSLQFVTGMREWSTVIRGAHGEATAKRELAAVLQQRYVVSGKLLTLHA
ncbi:MBL fold metallo-hydrolase RNA specificity domain-containing protein [Pseudomonas sp.]|uniref:MBL fold metallo-hydrolase RNA specificity domain-containing protein n=1 Tax=Pseudomonas sp. TaxID=306 RepID=UPI00308111B2